MMTTAIAAAPGKVCDEDDDLKGKSREEFCAFIKTMRFGNGKLGNRAPPKQPPAREALARDVKDARCGNCDQEDHTSQTCPKERRGPDQ